MKLKLILPNLFSYHRICSYHRNAVFARAFASLSSLGPFDDKAIRLIKEHNERQNQCQPPETETAAHQGSSSSGTFSMVLPPPNVTGNLHIGHAITVAIEDAICRYQKLLGKKVRWVPGFDHAGMATQTVVQKQLQRRLGKRREELSDDEFLAYCEHWKEERIRDITTQLRSLDCSLDWPELFYTMDENFSRAVRAAFCRLHARGLIMRESRPVYLQNTTEPVMMEQWFLHMDGMNDALRADLQAGKFDFTPSMNAELTDEFLKFREPWNLSRQILWGHRIPAYQVQPSGRWIVAETEADARAQLTPEEHGATLRQDPDVLDTWFSSSLIPIVVMGWPDQPIDGQSLDLMETGHDIVGHWVAKMMMLCNCLTGHYPFTRVLLHGMVRDSRDRKMSKSLGNVVDPLDIIHGVDLQRMVERMRNSNLPPEEMDVAEEDLRKRFPSGMRAAGVDAFRCGLLAHDLTKPVLRVDFSLPLSEGRNFCNRVWNLCKYAQRVFLQAQRVAEGGEAAVVEETEEDRVVLQKLTLATHAYHQHMQRLETHNALDALCRFIGDNVNDVYLESTKGALRSGDAHRLPAIASTFRTVVATSLGLLQPFLPQLCTFLAHELQVDEQAAAARALRQAVIEAEAEESAEGKDAEQGARRELKSA